MFEHDDAVGRGQRDRAARPALADDRRDDGHVEVEARRRRAGDGFGLPALLGLDAGEGPGRVDQRHHRQAEARRHLHQADRLAIPLGPAHAEVVGDAAGGVAALLVADDHDRPPLQPADAADDRRVLAELAVAGEGHEVVDQPGDIILEMRPLGVARDDRLLPRRQSRIDVGQLALGALGQPVGFGPRLGRPLGAEVGDAGFELGDGLFEFEEGDHRGAG